MRQKSQSLATWQHTHMEMTCCGVFLSVCSQIFSMHSLPILELSRLEMDQFSRPIEEAKLFANFMEGAVFEGRIYSFKID